MKFFILIVGLLAIGGGAAAWAVTQNKSSYSLFYKMTVIVETPEGDVSGYAIREISNSVDSHPIPDVGNSAQVRGEAVAINLGKRGILFALISHQSDLEFYNAFPVPGKSIGNGGSTLEGIRYYASLPVGTKGVLNPIEPPGYPKIVTFTDIKDPKSVIEAQVWERKNSGKFYLKEDRMEKLFGLGVRLKGIELEISGAPVSWASIDEYLPESFWKSFRKWMKEMNIGQRDQYIDLFTFRQGTQP